MQVKKKLQIFISRCLGGHPGSMVAETEMDGPMACKEEISHHRAHQSRCIDAVTIEEV